MNLMKRTVKYALSAAMAAVFVVPAIAQSDTPFPDTKDNHWAYEAVTRLKADGILVGYPNGMFIGNRLATRYEMAVAINAAYTKLKNITDGLSKQIDDINGKITELQNKGGPSQADFDALKASLNDVRDQVNGMKSYAQDIADLKRLSEKFEKDLAAMGVDVDDLKKSLAALDKRVGVLEAHRLPIDIHGDMNFMTMSGFGTSGSYGVDVTGRPLGVGRGADPYSAMSDNTLFHELGFDITTNNEKGPKGEIVAVVGNMIDTAGGFANGSGSAIGPFSSQSTGSAGTPYAPGNESVYIQKAVFSWGDEASGLPFSGQAGRIGLKLGSYILERPDYNPYYDNARWSNGEWSVDGIKLGFKFGPTRLHVFAAEASTATDTQGTLIQPMLLGGNGPLGPGGLSAANSGVNNAAVLGEVNQIAGAHLWVPIGKDGNIDLSYVLLQSNNGFGGTANNVQDWGVDANYRFTSAIKAWGGYSKTDAQSGTHNVNNKNDARATGYLGYEATNWGVSAGYKYIEPLFAAPGYWGRIGTWWNPTNIEGVDAAAHFDFNKSVMLKGTYEYYTGMNKSVSPFGTDTKIQRGTADLAYKFGTGVGVDLGVEGVQVTGPALAVFGGGTGKPQELWYNIGASYDFSDNAKFSVLFQYSDLKNILFSSGAFANTANTSNKGGLITTQFSIKF